VYALQKKGGGPFGVHGRVSATVQHGRPVLVECKLWRNPEGRREVIGQILDYSKELTRWSSSDLQREASRKLKRDGNPLLDLVREAGHEIDESVLQGSEFEKAELLKREKEMLGQSIFVLIPEELHDSERDILAPDVGTGEHLLSVIKDLVATEVASHQPQVGELASDVTDHRGT
jgi:hypothetical protein